MTLAVPDDWTGSGGRLDVQVTTSAAEGSWLVATIAYRTVDGTEPLASVADIGGNWWVLCGSAVNAATGTRVEVWACPKIAYAGFPLAIVYSAVSHIHADDTGSHVVNVAEVTGFANGYPTVVSATTGTASGTSLSIVMPDPGKSVLVLAAAATEDTSKAVTAPGTGWTALTAVERDDPDLVLTPAWAATDDTITATWSTTGSSTWTGVVVAIAETGTVWDQPNEQWPATRLEIGAGYGQDVPLTRIPAADWVDHTDRFEELDGASRGIPYDLGAPQAGEAIVTLANFDDEITSEAGGDYDLYTPYRLLMAWDGKIYPVSAGWLEEAVRTWRDPHHGYVEWQAVDALATLVQNVPSALRGDILRRRPYAYWPLDDPSGSLVAANASPRSLTPLQMFQSKHGVHDATASFGASTDIDGDPGSGWQQQGLVSADTKQGFALVAQDFGFPAISGGITIIGLTQFDTDLNAQPSGGVTLCILRSSDARNSTVIKFWMETSLGDPRITVWDKDTAVGTTTNGSSGMVQEFVIPWCIRFNRTSWKAFHTTRAIEFSGSCDLPDSWHTLDIGGEADHVYNGNSGNATHAHIALFDRQLTDGEVDQLINNAVDGWKAGESSRLRAQRYMATGGSLLPRAIDSGNTVGSRDDESAVLLQRLADLAAQEAGLLYGDAAGYLRLRTSSRSYQQAVRWTLGEDTSAGEIPFQPAATVTSGPTYLYNRINVTATDEHSETVTSQAWGQRTHIANDTSSEARYGTRPLNQTVNLYYTGDAQHLAEWLLAQYKLPTPRFADVIVDAARYPAAWPLVLGVEVGDLLEVKRTPVGQAAITARCRVLQVKPAVSGGLGATRGQVVLTLAAAPPPALVLGDPGKDVLGDTTIGWH